MKLEQAARQVIDAWDLGEFSTRMDESITALREALADPQITTPDVCGEVCARAKLCYGCNKNLEEANAKYAEQAEQEPVAWKDLTYGNLHHQDFGNSIPLYAAPVQQAEQKPIGYVIEDNDYEGSKIWAEPINGCCLPVYLAPVRTKDLTDDEIEKVYWSSEIHGRIDGIRAVIAADREKNK